MKSTKKNCTLLLSKITSIKHIPLICNIKIQFSLSKATEKKEEKTLEIPQG